MNVYLQLEIFENTSQMFERFTLDRKLFSFHMFTWMKLCDNEKV